MAGILRRLTPPASLDSPAVEPGATLSLSRTTPSLLAFLLPSSDVDDALMSWLPTIV
jgi:hypothetical protein